MVLYKRTIKVSTVLAKSPKLAIWVLREGENILLVKLVYSLSFI